MRFHAARPDTYRIAIFTKRHGIADQIHKNLRQTGFEAMNA